MTITDGLTAEHNIFLGVFDHIECLLPDLNSILEVSAMARLVECLLQDHADQETQLAYAALDHALAHNGTLERLHTDHEELDNNLLAVHKSPTCSIAKKRLKLALLATRRHFRQEERAVFPLIEKNLEPETLKELGKAWAKGRRRPLRA